MKSILNILMKIVTKLSLAGLAMMFLSCAPKTGLDQVAYYTECIEDTQEAMLKNCEIEGVIHREQHGVTQLKEEGK